MSENTLVGLEIDGDRVTVVESLGDLAVSSLTTTGATLKEALQVALHGYSQKKSSPPLRVVVVAPGTTLRRMDVTEKIASSRLEFEDAVFDLLPVARDASSVAGVFFDPDSIVGDTLSGGAAAVAPLALVKDVYSCLGRLRAEVVPSPLLVGGYDGVWLGLHYSAAEATLVRDGHPVAFRQLRAGGLAGVAAVLGDDTDPELGRRRLGDLLARTSGDPIADAELARYLRMVATELAQTAEFWRRQGEDVPFADRVIAYGPGATAAHLRDALAEASIVPVIPDTLVNQMSLLSPSQRQEALLGFLASCSVGEQMPQISFANPVADKVAEDARRRKRRTVKTATVAAVGGLLAVAVGIPAVSSYVATRDAEQTLAAAEARALPVADVYHQTVDLQARQDVVADVLAQEVAWSQVLAAVYNTRPADTKVTRVSGVVSEDAPELLMTVEGEKLNGTYEELSGWLDRMVTERGASDAWTSGFSTINGLTTYQMSFRLPISQVPSARSGGSGSGEAVQAAPSPSAAASAPAASAEPTASTPAEPAASPSPSPSASTSAPASSAPSPSSTPSGGAQ